MSYIFSNQAQGKAIVTDENDDSFTINGINGQQQSADSLMSGLSILFDLVGWQVTGDVVRQLNQNVVEE